MNIFCVNHDNILSILAAKFKCVMLGVYMSASIGGKVLIFAWDLVPKIVPIIVERMLMAWDWRYLIKVIACHVGNLDLLFHN